MVASIPMKGDIDSLNASVAAGVLAYEIVRQRLAKQQHGSLLRTAEQGVEQLWKEQER